MHTFHDIDQNLSESEALVGAAEAHGLLCGYICAGSGENDQQWLDSVFDTEGEMPEQQHDTVNSLYRDSFSALQHFDISFQLLLPDESYPLQERAEALTQWCDGLLSGVALGGGTLTKNDDIKEIIHDLSEISQLQLDDIGESDEQQQQFFELCEHVRMSTLLLHSLLQTPTHNKTH